MNGTAYFDNAATTFPKPEMVYEFADKFYRTQGGNAGRGKNPFSNASIDLSRQVKDSFRKMYGCPSHDVVFTSSATEALNRILLGLDLMPGDTVFVTPFEHNAVTRPLFNLEREKGINLKIMPFEEDTLLPNYEAIRNLMECCTPRLIVMTHASNVCGLITPVETLARLGKEFGATTVVDMSQTCGLLSLDIASSGIDFAVFAGHKTLYGPFGIGGFICPKGTTLLPVIFGGNGIDSVNQEMPRDIVSMSEIGSQNIYAIAGLKASTEWILSKGLHEIEKAEQSNAKTLEDLLRRHSNIEIVGRSKEADFVGLFSARFEGYSPDEIELILGNAGISVRSGLHCSPFAHRFLQTLPSGTVRFSVSALTTEEDFNELEKQLALIETEG